MRRYILILIIAILAGCSSDSKGPGTGVSKILAEKRFSNITDVKYTLHFSIPNESDSVIKGDVKINFTLKNREMIYLDFLHDSLLPVNKLLINGIQTEPEITDEH